MGGLKPSIRNPEPWIWNLEELAMTDGLGGVRDRCRATNPAGRMKTARAALMEGRPGILTAASEAASAGA
jgi:hypothetical protein